MGTIASIKKDLKLLENCWELRPERKEPFLVSIAHAEAAIIEACDRKSEFPSASVSLVKTKKS